MKITEMYQLLSPAKQSNGGGGGGEGHLTKFDKKCQVLSTLFLKCRVLKKNK